MPKKISTLKFQQHSRFLERLFHFNDVYAIQRRSRQPGSGRDKCLSAR
jgi:hypothetical protein